MRTPTRPRSTRWRRRSNADALRAQAKGGRRFPPFDVAFLLRGLLDRREIARLEDPDLEDATVDRRVGRLVYDGKLQPKVMIAEEGDAVFRIGVLLIPLSVRPFHS